MTTKTLPPHGTLYRYAGPKDQSWDPCRCPQCVKFHARSCKKRDLERASDNPPSVPIEPIARHLDLLIASGMSYSLIAARAGVSRNSVSKIYARRGKFVHRHVAHRIAAVKAADFDDRANRPAIGTMRRVQALYAIGHGARSIAAASGLPEQTVSLLANGHWQTVGGPIAQAIRLAYRKLAWKPGSSAIARARAVRQGWYGPLDWDGDIDDPATEPEQAVAEPEQRSTKRDEARHLLLSGESVRAVQERTGASLSYVRQIAQEVLEGHARDRRRPTAA